MIQFFKKKENLTTVAKTNSFRVLNNILVSGVIFLLVLLLFLIVWDDYIFYKSNYQATSLATPGTYGEAISVEEIDKVMNSLDKRDQKFQDLLNQP